MKRKYFGEEYLFEFIWQHADRDGLWDGDAASVAAKFGVTEEEAHETLSDLGDRDLIQRVGNSTYIVTQWRERDESAEKEEAC